MNRKVPSLPSSYSSGQANLLPDDFVQEVRQRASVRSVIEPHVNLRQTGASLVGLCPFHKERTPSFSVSEGKGLYHCFGCGEHGDAITFLMKFAGQSFREAVEELAGAVGMAMPTGSSSDALENYDSLHERMDMAHRFFRHCLKHTPEPKEYLSGRGVKIETINEYGVAYAPKGWQSLKEAFGDEGYAQDPDLVKVSLVREKDGRRYDVFRDRLIFPIKDRRGRIIGFGGRSMDGTDPKYLNSPESPLFNKSSTLFGFHEARPAILAEKRVVVVEGYMDVMMLSQYGILPVVATMGTACTAEQIERLCALAPMTIFTFDGDAAGKKAAWRALERCLPFVKETHEFRFCMLPDGKDPDDLVKEEGAAQFSARLDQSSGLTHFLLTSLSQKHGDLESPEHRARFLAEGMEMVRKLPRNSAYVQIVADELTRVSRVGPAYLASMRQMHRRQGAKFDVWAKMLDAVRRFPAAAKSIIPAVVDSLSDEDYALLSEDAFANDHERVFWEYFLGLSEIDCPSDLQATEFDDMAYRDMVSSLVTLIGNQLRLQRNSRLSSQYRKGNISESEFIEAKVQRVDGG